MKISAANNVDKSVRKTKGTHHREQYFQTVLKSIWLFSKNLK